jgi:hypothetical protein
MTHVGGMKGLGKGTGMDPERTMLGTNEMRAGKGIKGRRW